ncbi:hypothetical protein MRB53_020444 [Persea americana]|uniref:Uncharacterized protein n=1 Tax=Persea americana TaxID=3435 RepID=A0ACC2L224_PERAE|nr:hypothetical protein MRB53_020444 [Persea americana]
MKGKLPIQVRKIGKKRESSQIRWAKAGQHGGTGQLGWMEGEVVWGGLLLLPFSNASDRQRKAAAATLVAMGRLWSSSPGLYDPKNPSLFRCNNPDFLVSTFPTVVFFDNTKVLPTRGNDDGEESLRRLAVWHDDSAKPAAIPFPGFGDDGHHSSAPLVGIVTEPSYLSEIRFENTKSIMPLPTYFYYRNQKRRGRREIVTEMDKSWIDLPNRMSREYMDGINQFMKFTNGFDNEFISCPCRKCANRYYYRREFVREHMILNEFLKQYKNWIRHGEEYVSCCREERDEIEVDDMSEADPMIAMLNDIACGLAPKYTSYDAQTELYPGCKDFSKLSFIVELLHLKALNQWSDTSFDMLLQLLHRVLPSGTKLVESYYQARKLTENLGFTYETLDACPNNCMLFRNENAHLDMYIICQTSRWKEDGVGYNRQNSSTSVVNHGKRVAAKQGKSKDGVNARLDLEEMGLRKPLHLQLRESNKAYMPPAQYTMSKDEKDVFLPVLKGVKVRDGTI